MIKEALDKLGYTDEMYQLLKEPLRMLTVRMPVRMDGGSTKIFTGYRAQHNDAVGPTKGGVRFHPEMDEDAVKAFDVDEFKCSIVDLLCDGGKGVLFASQERCQWEN